MKIEKEKISMIFFIITISALLFVSVGRISHSSSNRLDYETKVKFFRPVIDSLLKKGADSNFIFSLLADSKTQFNEKYIRINVAGYLRKTPETKSYDWKAVEKCRNFLTDYSSILDSCEKIYSVSREIVVSILWVETRLGDYLGSNHVPSVFFSTAMASLPDFINLNIYYLKKNFSGDSLELDSLMKKIYKRSYQKADWAINEILSLDKLHKRSPISPANLYGSWSGAFGISQFLPSSYLKWAVDGNGNKAVNIFETEDAIMSVGNYLKNHGWGNSEDEQKNSIFAYNNSWDYVSSVKKLSNRLKPIKTNTELGSDTLSKPVIN